MDGLNDISHLHRAPPHQLAHHLRAYILAPEAWPYRTARNETFDYNAFLEPGANLGVQELHGSVKPRTKKAVMQAARVGWKTSTTWRPFPTFLPGTFGEIRMNYRRSKTFDGARNEDWVCCTAFFPAYKHLVLHRVFYQPKQRGAGSDDEEDMLAPTPATPDMSPIPGSPQSTAFSSEELDDVLASTAQYVVDGPTPVQDDPILAQVLGTAMLGEFWDFTTNDAALAEEFTSHSAHSNYLQLDELELGWS